MLMCKSQMMMVPDLILYSCVTFSSTFFLKVVTDLRSPTWFPIYLKNCGPTHPVSYRTFNPPWLRAVRCAKRESDPNQFLGVAWPGFPRDEYRYHRDTVDGSEIRFTSWYGESPIIYRVFIQVVQDFWTINSINIVWSLYLINIHMINLIYLYA